MIKGDDIIVLTNIGGTTQPVAACKSCNINVDQDFIEACAPNSGRTHLKIPTTYDWGIDCDCLMATTAMAKLFLDAIKSGTAVTLQFIVAGFKQRGTAHIKSWKVSGPKNGVCKFNVSFVGSGPLSDATDWDFINGTLYTYSNYDEPTKTLITQGRFFSGETPDEGDLYPPTQS